jgi:hypothetical protein
VDTAVKRLRRPVRACGNHPWWACRYCRDNHKAGNRWVIRDPLWITITCWVEDQIKCWRGQHNVKMGSYGSCVSCGKKVTS